MGAIDNMPSLFRVMAHPQTGDKLLPEPRCWSRSLALYSARRLQWVNLLHGELFWRKIIVFYILHHSLTLKKAQNVGDHSNGGYENMPYSVVNIDALVQERRNSNALALSGTSTVI